MPSATAASEGTATQAASLPPLARSSSGRQRRTGERWLRSPTCSRAAAATEASSPAPPSSTPRRRATPSAMASGFVYKLRLHYVCTFTNYGFIMYTQVRMYIYTSQDDKITSDALLVCRVVLPVDHFIFLFPCQAVQLPRVTSFLSFSSFTVGICMRRGSAKNTRVQKTREYKCTATTNVGLRQPLLCRRCRPPPGTPGPRHPQPVCSRLCASVHRHS